jgi:Holliday junction resolvase RusA-like endonuclease
MKFSFTVLGPPQPKQRPRLGRRGRVYTPEATTRFETAIAWAAVASKPQGWPTTARYRLTVEAYFGDRRKRDFDNVLKAVADGLNPRPNGLPYVWQDDSQVFEGTIRKYLKDPNPRTVVTVEVVDPQPPA